MMISRKKAIEFCKLFDKGELPKHGFNFNEKGNRRTLAVAHECRGEPFHTLMFLHNGFEGVYNRFPFNRVKIDFDDSTLIFFMGNLGIFWFYFQ